MALWKGKRIIAENFHRDSMEYFYITNTLR